MRDIITHLRNAQELIFEQYGREMEIAIRVPEDVFIVFYRERFGPVGPYAYTHSFELMGITIMREGATIV